MLPIHRVYSSINVLSLLLAICCLSSCATVLNTPFTTVNLRIPSGSSVTGANNKINITTPSLPAIDSAEHFRDKVPVQVKRGEDPLVITTTNGNTTTILEVKRIYSAWYWANIYPSCGLGFIVDRFSPKRFGYPHNLYIDMPATAPATYSKHKPYNIPGWEWTLTPPVANVFQFNLNNVNADGNVVGIGSGVNYHYNAHNFILIDAGIARVGFRLLGKGRFDTLPYHYSEFPNEQKNGRFVAFRHHHIIGRFDLGYGISVASCYGMRYFRSLNYRSADSVAWSERTRCLGGSFTAAYRITNTMFAHINYLPLAYESGTTTRFNYQHILVFGLCFRFNFYNRY